MDMVPATWETWTVREVVVLLPCRMESVVDAGGWEKNKDDVRKDINQNYWGRTYGFNPFPGNPNCCLPTPRDKTALWSTTAAQTLHTP